MHHEKKIIDKVVGLMIENHITPAALVAPYERAAFKAKKRNPGELYSGADICRVLKISKSSLRRYVDMGMPYHDRTDGKRGKLYSKRECLSFVKQYRRVCEKGKK